MVLASSRVPAKKPFGQLWLLFFFSVYCQRVCCDKAARRATADIDVSSLGNSVEDRLTKSLLNCPLCAGSVPCMIDCKYGGQTWEKCLHKCLADNPIMRDMFLSMFKSMTARANDATATVDADGSETVDAIDAGPDAVSVADASSSAAEEPDDL
eukprot:TRINITY_DN39166_c0_g1_i1.p1 TRINITY_DN39166_c0_g1~~TRINITY_DN39166_c0_g1_i1.p1  ORF type:complete len:162 (-),score=33.99 TRINITY_DN39166_c0_g1_i1:244-705(-)